MSKKTKQNFKIGSGFVDEKKELKSEIMILRAEIERLKEENKMYSKVNFELKRELNRLDRSEKQQLEYRINSLECENEEMREKLELIGDGADLLSICGMPINFFNKTMGLLLGSKEESKSMINQLLIKPIQPILNVKKEDE